MKKNIPLYILLLFLIIVNGFFLYNYLGKSDSKNEKESKNALNFVIKQLNFDDIQLEKLESINVMHHEKMRRIGNDTRVLKDLLFSNLSAETVNKRHIDSVTNLIGDKEEEKEAEVFYHFRSIQELCNEQQRDKFEKIITEALRKGDENRPPPGGMDRNGPPPPRNGDMHDGPPPPRS